MFDIKKGLQLVFRTLKYFLLLTLLGCQSGQTEEELVVGTSADNPPFEFLYKGEIVGFDIDLINEVAARLGKELKINNMEFNGIIPALNSHHLDAAIAAITSTEHRAKQVDFSSSYASANIAILVPQSSNVNSAQDLQNAKIGVQAGTTWELIAKQLQQKTEELSLVMLTNNLLLVEELKNERIDGILLEATQANNFTAANIDNKGLRFFTLPEYSSNFAIAFAKGKDSLKKEVDRILEELVKEGFIDKLKQKWLY